MANEWGWLIEAPGPFYLGVRKLGKWEFYWTTEHDKATRFYNREQADKAMLAIRESEPELFKFAVNLRDAVPAEHAWSDFVRTEDQGLV